MSLLNDVLNFRRGLLQGRDSGMMCFAVCAPLQGYLEVLGVKTELTCGEVLEQEHYWLTLPDGRIIDPTADQFNGQLVKMPKVYIGPKPSVYKT